MGIEISIKLGDIPKLKSDITIAFAREILSILKSPSSLMNDINSDTRTLLRTNLKSSPEYTNLISGEGPPHFGFYAGTAQSTVDAIIEIWVDSIIVGYNKSVVKKTTANIQFILQGIQTSYLDVLSSKDAIVPYFSRRFKGRTKDEKHGKVISVPWLEWFLKGNSRKEPFKLPLEEFRIAFGDVGRSGQAHMEYRFRSKGTLGDPYDLPASLKGDKDNNWIERTLLNTVPDINNLIIKRVEEYFG